jgi:hypothetical protein
MYDVILIKREPHIPSVIAFIAFMAAAVFWDSRWFSDIFPYVFLIGSFFILPSITIMSLISLGAATVTYPLLIQYNVIESSDLTRYATISVLSFLLALFLVKVIRQSKDEDEVSSLIYWHLAGYYFFVVCLVIPFYTICKLLIINGNELKSIGVVDWVVLTIASLFITYILSKTINFRITAYTISAFAVAISIVSSSFIIMEIF